MENIKNRNQDLLLQQKLVEDINPTVMNFQILEKERKEICELLLFNGIDFVFDKFPELEKIGTKEEYKEYLKTIFPDSICKNIVYHGNKNDDYFEKFEHKPSVNFDYQHNSFFATSNINDAETGGTGNTKRKDNVIPILLNMTKENTGILKKENIVKKDTDTFQYNGKGEFKPQEIDEMISKYSKIWKEKKWKWKRISPTRLDIERPDRIRKIIGIWKENDCVLDLSANMGYIGDINESKVNLLKKNGLNGVVIDENRSTYLLGLAGEKSWYIVFDPNQIYVLGLKKDLNGFKKFVKKIGKICP